MFGFLRKKIKEVKTQLELKLSTDTRSHKKGVYRYASYKKKLGKVKICCWMEETIY